MSLNDHRFQHATLPINWQAGEAYKVVWFEIEIFKLTHCLINIQITLQLDNADPKQLWAFEEFSS